MYSSAVEAPRIGKWDGFHKSAVPRGNVNEPIGRHLGDIIDQWTRNIAQLTDDLSGYPLRLRCLVDHGHRYCPQHGGIRKPVEVTENAARCGLHAPDHYVGIDHCSAGNAEAIAPALKIL